MTPATPGRRLRPIAIALFVCGSAAVTAQQRPREPQEGFRFRTGIELINVTATVTDRNGRFVAGLQKEDFRVYEDGERQTITHFSNERVPVSLGIALDTSGSMEGEKFAAARQALNRFLYDLLDPADEVFLYAFASDPELVRPWTTDRRAISRALAGLRPRGGTALYDTVVEAVGLAQTGGHAKKALLVISDGHDTSSRTDLAAVRQLVRETEVLVYAIGIDGAEAPVTTSAPRWPRRPPRMPLPLPIPGRRPPAIPWPDPGPPQTGGGGRSSHDRVNAAALRELTDDSGGRTEIIRRPRDLDPATTAIANELSQQYYLGYPSRGLRDGRWHSIEVDVDNQNYRVRARRGYVATP